MCDEVKNLFLIPYAIAKDLVSDLVSIKSNADKSTVNIATKIISSILAVILLLIVWTSLVPFRLLHLCLDQLLKLKHGALYGGFLNGLDSIFEIKASKTVINVVLIISCTDQPPLLIEKLKHRAYSLYISNYKFGSAIHDFFGYKYYLKNQVQFQDIIKVKQYNESKYMSRKDLADYLEENCSTLKDSSLWKAVFFSQPILWRTNNGSSKQIAVVLTFRHALGDFPCLIGFIKTYFQFTEAIPRSIFPTAEHNLQDDAFNLDNVCVLRNPFKVPFREPIPNKCYHSKCHIATFIEEKAEYIPKIKKIKEKLKTTFVEAFSAAVFASISKYMEQQNMELNELPIGIVVRPLKEDIPKIVNKTFNFSNLVNNSGATILDVPFKLKNKTAKTILNHIRLQGQVMKYAVDALLLYTLGLHMNSYLPMPLTSFMTNTFVKPISGGISNVVGLPQSRLCENLIDDIFFFAPNFLNIGFTFFIYSYDDRLQVTAVSQRGFVRNREEVEEVLNNIFKYIDLLMEEM